MPAVGSTLFSSWGLGVTALALDTGPPQRRRGFVPAFLSLFFMLLFLAGRQQLPARVHTRFCIFDVKIKSADS